MDTLLAIASVLAGIAASSAFHLSRDPRPRRRCLIGRIETWRDDNTADATWYVLGLPVVRQNWTHSTHLID